MIMGWFVAGTCLPGLIYRMGKRVNGIGLLIFHLGNSMSGGGRFFRPSPCSVC